MTGTARRIAIYRRALRAHGRAARLSHAALDGLALGSFDRATLALLDQRFHDDIRENVAGSQRRFHDELSIQQGLFDWEREAVEAAFPCGGRVIVTAAGAGREVLALCEMGFDAYGFEPHPDLVRAGQPVLAARGLPGRLETCERDVWPAGAGTADAVILGWTSYSLTPGRARRAALLSGAHRTLPTGGPLLLSFGLREGRQRDLTVVSTVAGTLRRLRRAEPIEYGDWIVGDNATPLFIHMFSESELRDELDAAGFAIERLRARPYGHAVARAA